MRLGVERGWQQYRLAAVILLLGVFALVLWQVASWTRESELESLQRSLEQNLSRYTLSLQNELEKYQNLPALCWPPTEALRTYSTTPTTGCWWGP